MSENVYFITIDSVGKSKGIVRDMIANMYINIRKQFDERDMNPVICIMSGDKNDLRCVNPTILSEDDSHEFMELIRSINEKIEN